MKNYTGTVVFVLKTTYCVNVSCVVLEVSNLPIACLSNSSKLVVYYLCRKKLFTSSPLSLKIMLLNLVFDPTSSDYG